MVKQKVSKTHLKVIKMCCKDPYLAQSYKIFFFLFLCVFEVEEFEIDTGVNERKIEIFIVG